LKAEPDADVVIPPTLVARYGRIDEQCPGVDAALQVGEIPKSLTPEVFGGVLAAYAVVALEYDGRIPITEEQRIVIVLIKQARAVDPGYRALLLGADVDQLDSGAALEQGLQIRRRQLTNRRRLGCGRVLAQRSAIVARHNSLVKFVTGEPGTLRCQPPDPIRASDSKTRRLVASQSDQSCRRGRGRVALALGVRKVYAEHRREGRIQSAERAMPTPLKSDS
jgi:hypothetical protein